MYNLKHTVVFVPGTFYPVLSDCGWLPATEIEPTEITEGGEGEGGLEFEMVAGGGGLLHQIKAWSVSNPTVFFSYSILIPEYSKLFQNPQIHWQNMDAEEK